MIVFPTIAEAGLKIFDKLLIRDVLVSVENDVYSCRSLRLGIHLQSGERNDEKYEQ
jgi:hypothetical protein